MAVFNSNILAGASGQTSEAAAFQIDRSLRFSDSASSHLNKTFSSAGNRKTWTWSGWVKRANLDSSVFSLFAAYDSSDTRDVLRIESNKLNLQIGTSGTYRTETTDAVFRDPAAWYHVVAAFDSAQSTAADRVKLYVNGVEQSVTGTPVDQDTQSTINNADIHYIGARSTSGSARSFFDGYLTEINFVDGQALAPTDFGEYDANNVWQPKDTSGLTFGTNGFRLKFDDNSSDAALGNDSSGNDNDWTVNNLVATAGTVYSDTSSGMSSPGLMFDGDTSTSPSLTADGTVYTMLTGVSIACSSSLRINANANNFQVSVNGGSYTSAASVNSTYLSLSVPSSNTLTSLTFKDGAGGGYGVRALEVDGTVLVDGDPSAVDSLIDTPTNYTADSGNNGGNYATLNPLSIIQNTSGDTSKPTFSNGNLTYDGVSSKWGPGFGSIAIPSSGKWYFEATLASTTTNAVVGIAKYLYATGNRFWDQGTGTQTLFKSAGGGITHNSTSQASGTALSANDVVGVAINCDDDEVKFYRNGSLEATVDTPSNVVTAIDNGEAFPFVDSYDGIDWYLNFGQRPFSNSSIPTDHLSLCTQNLPDPTIADGSDYFETVLWTGDGTNNRKITTPFSPDFVWAKFRNQAYSHGLYDTVRGDDKRLVSNSTAAEGTVSLGMESDGFVVEGSSSYNDNNDTFVAWTWEAADSNTSISAGDSNSSVYNTSDKWSDDVSGNTYGGADMPKSRMFNGNLTQNVIANSGTSLTFSPSGLSSISSLRIYGSSYTGNTNGITVNGTAYTSSFPQGGGSSAAWVTIPETSLTSVVWSTTSSGLENGNLFGIEVDGKLLVDNDQTPPNVPSIASTVRANQTAGFSIVTYTDPTDVQTVGHGLNAPPEFIIIKSRTGTTVWLTYHKSLGKDYYTRLDDTDASYNVSNIWGSEEPTSSVFGVKGDDQSNMVAYCWTAVEGYSAFGSYEGTGSASTAAFVYTGMRPRWIMVKNADDGTSASDWFIYDTARSTFNAVDDQLYPNRSNAEATTSTHAFDILSNGFRVRSTSTSALSNKSGDTYIYAAFAEHPFKTARAR